MNHKSRHVCALALDFHVCVTHQACEISDTGLTLGPTNVMIPCIVNGLAQSKSFKVKF